MIPLRKRRLSRRGLLRGAAASGGAVGLGLPLLDIMLDEHGEALAGGEALPRRFITWFFGNGVNLRQFEPEEVGEHWNLSPLLSPLEPVKEHVSVCSGLHNHTSQFITHHEGLIAFSGYNYILRPDLPNFASDWGGPTVDQVIAEAIADEVGLPVPSMQVGVSRFLSEIDNGTTAEALSCRGAPDHLTALPPLFQPIDVWEYLFGEFVAGGPDDSELRQTALDLVKDDVDRLRDRLGVVDNQRLDAHLQAVAELEAKIAAIEPLCEFPEAPTLVNDFPNGEEPLTEINQVMSELIAAAFRCDITRVASVKFIDIAAEVVLTEASESELTHHSASHVVDGEAYDDNVTYIMGRVSDLLQVLQAEEEPDGTTLLDSSIVMATSDCSVGWTHLVRRQPVVLGGHGRGALVHPGIHYQAVAAPDPAATNAPSARNVSDVILTCLRAFVPDATEIGDEEPYSNAPIAELEA